MGDNRGPSSGVFGDLHLLRDEVQIPLLQLVALAPGLERRHRRAALVRELVSHLVAAEATG